MRITYDSSVDAAYIVLVDKIGFGEVATTHLCDTPSAPAEIYLDFDTENRLVGIEVQLATQALRAETLARACAPDVSDIIDSYRGIVTLDEGHIE